MRFALFVLLVCACGPRVNPEGPAAEPTTTVPEKTEPAVAVAVSASREVIVGEMCPTAVRGRPAVMPTSMRRISWDDDSGRIADVLARGMAKQMSVFGWAGKRVGLFTAAGAATAKQRTYAMGSYGGGSACETGGTNSRPLPECEKAMLSCGLAVGVLRPSGGLGSAPFEEDPDPETFESGEACIVGKRLAVDIDSDGRVEAFPIAAFLNDFREPADEVVADEGVVVPTCDSKFAIRGVVSATDPRDWRGLDLLGVIDLDGDGRHELIMAYNYQDRRTWAVFSAQSSSGRLDLVTEGRPWPRPQSGQSQPVSEADLDE